MESVAHPLDRLAAACAPVADQAGTLVDHLVAGRWRDAATLLRDAVTASGDGPLTAMQGWLPVLGL